MRLYTTSGAGHYTDWDDLSLQLMEAQTDNKGSLGGVAYLGNKSTTTTFPSQLSPHGNKADGGDYLDMATPITNTNQAFTVGGLFRLVPSAYAPLVSTSPGTSAGFELRTENGVIYLYAWSSSGNWIGRYSTLLFNSGVHSVFATYDGSFANTGMAVYVDGERVDTTGGAAGSFVAASITNNLRIGNNLSSNYAPNGTCWYRPMVFNSVLTPLQISILHNRLMNGLNI